MFLVYDSLEYKAPEVPILPSVICRLWWPTNYNGFRLSSQYYATKNRNFLTQIIITTFLLKYCNNAQIMADFSLKLKDFYNSELDFLPISELCKKYGRNISLKYIIAAYNICLMFAKQLDCYDYKHFYTSFSENIELNKDFVNNATNDINDINFGKFTKKYGVKILERNKIPNEVHEMLHDSLAHAVKLTFIGYYNSAKQPISPYNNDLNVTSFAKNIFNKKFGLQTLYCVMSIGNVLSHYYYNYSTRIYDYVTKNLVESRSGRFINKIENIFNKLYVKNGDFTTISNYLKLVQDDVRYALRDLNKFEYNKYDYNERLDFSKPYCSDDSSGRLQVDSTATITKIRKLCRLLDYNIVDELIKMPVNMWETILDSKRDRFDNIMDEFNLAIINCANLAFSTIVDDHCYFWKSYVISFNKSITPTYIKIEFNGGQNIDHISYNIFSYMKFYDYFNVVDDVETKTVTENRLKMVKQVETCLKNMKKLESIKQVRENINVIVKEF